MVHGLVCQDRFLCALGAGCATRGGGLELAAWHISTLRGVAGVSRLQGNAFYHCRQNALQNDWGKTGKHGKVADVQGDHGVNSCGQVGGAEHSVEQAFSSKPVLRHERGE